MPKVSIVIPSYNHEHFIRECIQSALDQTYQDFEIVITDDGSSDGSVDAIREFSDPRIKLHLHARNIGACAAMNSCIRHASGEYVAVLNSDDAWEPTKLAKQVDYLDRHAEIAAVFTRVRFVSESGAPLTAQDYSYFHVFDQENRSRFAWLKFFFSGRNCLCHPSIVIRKSSYDEVGLYDERMANIPDLDMWVRLCLKHEIYILNDKLIRFRIRDNEANASGNRLPNHIRTRFEHLHVLDHYLNLRDKGIFLRIFPEARQLGEVQSDYIPYFLAKLALGVGIDSWDLWGLNVLYGLLGNPSVAKSIQEQYGFGCLDFHRLTARTDVFKLAPAPESVLVVRAAGLSLCVNPRSKLGIAGTRWRGMLTTLTSRARGRVFGKDG